VVGLSGYGLKVVERVPLLVGTNETNEFYMKTKEEKMGHILNNSIVDSGRAKQEEGNNYDNSKV